MTDYRQALAQLSAQQSATIARHTLPDGETVWIRHTGKTIAPWRYRLLGAGARLLRLGALTPVPNPGGQAALDTEARRLEELGTLGIPVPRLLAAQEGAIMFSHLGELTLLAELENLPDPLEYWQDGLAAVSAVHHRGACLSQAFARNIIRQTDGSIGFIDFEDDPQQHMPLPLCQSRDWLCYLQSSALCLQQRGLDRDAAAVWQRHQAQLPDNVRLPVVRAVSKIRFLRHFNHPVFGRDTLRLAALARLCSAV